MTTYLVALAIFFALGTRSGQAQSAADCMQALRAGDNLGFLQSHAKLVVSTVVVALPLNTLAVPRINVGWLYIDQFGLEWVQLNRNATSATRQWYHIHEKPGISGIYAAHPPAVPSWLRVESCQ